MLLRRFSLGLALLLTLGVVACNRKASMEAALARDDLLRVCQAQRSYLETRKLMKSVSEKDLAKEREAHFKGDVKTSLVREALTEARRAPMGKRRIALDSVAAKTGFQSWKCPELDHF